MRLCLLCSEIIAQLYGNLCPEKSYKRFTHVDLSWELYPSYLKYTNEFRNVEFAKTVHALQERTLSSSQ
ncbi:hypothetical protein T4A_12282, partial [Trichinella pseudospiralis]